MNDIKDAVTHLQIINTWAAFARERDLQFFTTKHLDEIVSWTNDAIALLKEHKPKADKCIICEACGHKLDEDWNWCPWCRWETAKMRNRLKEQTTELCDRCGRRRLKSNREER